jgi:hypothetical protein
VPVIRRPFSRSAISLRLPSDAGAPLTALGSMIRQVDDPPGDVGEAGWGPEFRG